MSYPGRFTLRFSLSRAGTGQTCNFSARRLARNAAEAQTEVSRSFLLELRRRATAWKTHKHRFDVLSGDSHDWSITKGRQLSARFICRNRFYFTAKHKLGAQPARNEEALRVYLYLKYLCADILRPSDLPK